MAIEYQDVVYDGGANPLNNPHAVDVTEVGGNVYAVVGGGDDTLAVYGIDSDPMSPTFGELTDTPVSTYVDDATVGLQKIRDIDSIEIDGVRYIFAGGDEGGISVFSLDAAGTLTNVDNVFDTDDPTNLELANLKSITTAAVDDGAGGTNYFVFGAGNDAGVSVFQVANDGTLTNTDNVDDDGTLSLSKVNNMDTIRVDDGAGGTNTFLITGSADGGLSVFEVASDGTLTNTDNVADDGTMYLAATDAVETHTINGVSYVSPAEPKTVSASSRSTAAER